MQGAEKRVGYESSAVTESASGLFVAEQIAELEGEFGLPSAGDQREVDYLHVDLQDTLRSPKVLTMRSIEPDAPAARSR